MARQLDEDFEALLINAVKGNGEVRYFSEEVRNESAERFAKFAEESEAKERLRKSKAMEGSSRIYLTI